MKNALVFIALSVCVARANAKTYCTINKENPKVDMSFDQSLWSGNVNTAINIVIKNDGTIIPNVDFKNGNGLKVKSKSDLAEFNNATVITIAPQQRNQLSIGTAHFDFSKKDNSLPEDAIAYGDASHSVSLIDVQKRISIDCVPPTAL